MRQIFFSILIFACWSPLSGQTVSENTAREVATSYFQAKTQNRNTGMATVHATAMRGGAPAYYVCVPDDGKGFVIVAGTKGSIPILAYSAEGDFSTEKMPPVVKYWMSGYQAQMEEIVEKRLRPTPEMTAEWVALENGTFAPPPNYPVGPFLQTRWHQSPYYNGHCPSSSSGDQAPTGCVATAMAQIMKYWNFPVSGSAYISDVDNDASDGISGTFDAWVGGDYYDWDDMPNALAANTPQHQKDEVSWLMYNCGVAAKMNYGTDGSGAYMGDARNALANIFGYSSCSVEWRFWFSAFDWKSRIQNELNMGRPVLYAGTDYTHTPATGHAWVCDGYDGDFFWMSWGWDDEDYNGYFSLANLNPTTTNNYYNSDQGAIMGIQPPGCVAYYEGHWATILGAPVSLETANYIHITSGWALPGTFSTMNAGREVVLSPGFTALEGCTAHIFIEGCNGAFASSTEDRSQPEDPIVETVTTNLDVSPNPFSGSTTITYTLPADQAVDVQIFNSVGSLVAQPVRQQLQDVGPHEYTFEAGGLPPGIYFLVMQTGGQKLTKRLVLAR